MSHNKEVKDSDKSLQDPRFERERNASATGSQKGTRRKLRTDASGKEVTGANIGKGEEFID